MGLRDAGSHRARNPTMVDTLAQEKTAFVGYGRVIVEVRKHAQLKALGGHAA
jgi:hypothetical protein